MRHPNQSKLRLRHRPRHGEARSDEARRQEAAGSDLRRARNLNLDDRTKVLVTKTDDSGTADEVEGSLVQKCNADSERNPPISATHRRV